MKIDISVLLFAFCVASSHGHTTASKNDYTVILKTESNISVLSSLVDQLRGHTTRTSRYLGCYKDDSKRLLNGPGTIAGTESMTHKWCINHCREKKIKYPGLEATNQCFYGNQLNTAKYPKLAEGYCNLPCKGNSTQICG